MITASSQIFIIKRISVFMMFKEHTATFPGNFFQLFVNIFMKLRAIYTTIIESLIITSLRSINFNSIIMSFH